MTDVEKEGKKELITAQADNMILDVLIVTVLIVFFILLHLSNWRIFRV